MINLRKRLSFSVVSMIALVFCCLVIGQAVTAKLTHKVATENNGQSNQIAVPLPGGERSGDSGNSAAVIGTSGADKDVVAEWVSPFATDAGPALLRFMKPGQTRPVPSGKGSGREKSGGQDAGTATVIGSLPYTDSDDLTGASDAADEDVGFGLSSPNGDLWYSYTPVSSEYATVSLCASALFDAKLYMYEGAVTPGTIYAGDDDACDAPSFGRSEISGVFLTGGTTYYIVVDGWEEAPYTLDVYNVSDPFACPGGAYSEVEACGADSNGACNAGDENATEDITPGDVCGTYWIDTGGSGSRDTDWYRYTATASPGESVTWTVTGELPTLAGILTCSDIDGTGVLALANIPAGTPTAFNAFVTPGDYYFYVAPQSGIGEFFCGAAPNPSTNYRYIANLATATPTPLDDCAAPGTIVDGTNNLDLSAATASGGLWFGNTPNYWYEYTATCTGTVTMSACASPYVGDFGIAVWNACESFGGSVIADGDDDCGADLGAGPNLMPDLSFVANSGQTYIVEVFSWGVFYGSPSPFSEIVTVDVACDPLVLKYDDCADALDTTGTIVDMLLTNEGANTDGPDQDECAPMGADVWVRYTTDCTGEITVDMEGFDAQISVYEGFDCLDVSPRPPIACVNGSIYHQDFNGATVWLDSPAPGTEFLLRLAGWDGTEGAFFLNISCDTPLPHPANDDCGDLTPVVLVPDGTVSEVSSTLYSTTAGCFSYPPGTWHSFDLQFCADVQVDFCDGPTGDPSDFPDSDVDVVTWTGSELFTDCPCEDGLAFADNTDFITCGDEGGVVSDVYLGLTPGTYYYFVSDVGQLLSAYESGGYQINFTTAELECAYCPSTHGSAPLCGINAEYIARVAVSGIDNSTGCGGTSSSDDGYANYSQDAPDGDGLVPGGNVYRGLTYDVTVEVDGISGGAHAEDIITVWVDWNQDYDLGLFSPSEMVLQSAPGDDVLTGQITVPFDAVLGDTGPSGRTVMRVGLIRESDGVNPCHGEFLFGETEDYLLFCEELVCGDFDDDGDRTAADVTFLRDYYFSQGALPDVQERGDINADCCINIADIVYLADYVHRGGADPICIPCN